MTRDDEICLAVGREMVRLFRELLAMTQDDTGYTRRRFTFPEGEAFVFIAKDAKFAAVFDRVADGRYNVETVTPPSQLD